jgi:hypothetical protein
MFILQDAATGTIAGNEVRITESDDINIDVSGTFNATIVLETSIDRINWRLIQSTKQTTDAGVSTITTPDLYLVRSIRNLWFRARIDGYTSGSITVKGEFA